MNVLKNLLSLFCRDFVETDQQPAAPTNKVVPAPPEEEPQESESAATDPDDGRPGYKVRWYH